MSSWNKLFAYISDRLYKTVAKDFQYATLYHELTCIGSFNHTKITSHKQFNCYTVRIFLAHNIICLQSAYFIHKDPKFLFLLSWCSIELRPARIDLFYITFYYDKQDALNLSIHILTTSDQMCLLCSRTNCCLSVFVTQ